MTDTPKILRDMTDAEIGAMVRAEGDGLLVTYRSHGDVWLLKGRGWDPYKAYRIAPPKFLPIEAGKVYLTRLHGEFICIAICNGYAYLSKCPAKGANALSWVAHTGVSPTLGYEWDIVGLSENQGEA